MAWAAIDEADLLTVISGTELSSLRTAAIAAGQDDPVDPSIEMVTDEVRGYIAACRNNTLGPDGTLPSKLKRTACVKVICAIIERVPGYDLSDDHVRSLEAADRLLGKVADCKFVVEEPEEETEETHPSPSPSISASSRAYTRTTEDGI